MSLKGFWGKRVILTDIDDAVFRGTVSIFTDKLNDPDNKDNITLVSKGKNICFYADEIKNIAEDNGILENGENNE